MRRTYWGFWRSESVRGNFAVVGEDLGTVTDEARAGFAEAGILSYRLLWFERDAAGNFRAPGEYPARALAATTTHDLPTLAGFAAGSGPGSAPACGAGRDEEEYRRQMASRAAETRAPGAGRWRTRDSRAIRWDFCYRRRACWWRSTGEDLTGETEQREFAWQHMAVSQLAAQDEISGGSVRAAGGKIRSRGATQRAGYTRAGIEYNRNPRAIP